MAINPFSGQADTEYHREWMRQEEMKRRYEHMQMSKVLSPSDNYGNNLIKQAPVVPPKNKKVLLCK